MIFLDIKSGDKSLSQRAALFSLLSKGVSRVENYARNEDCLGALALIKKLGARVEGLEGDEGCIKITPPAVLNSPAKLDCGNSGTAMRLLIGLLSAQKSGDFTLIGDEALSLRPMARVFAPLLKLGANISARDENFAPIKIAAKPLPYFEYESPVSSAQIKSALLLAGLLNNGCKLKEPSLSRDHSERMLGAMGAKITRLSECEIEIFAAKELNALDIKIANDPSSAFFLAVFALLKRKDLCLKSVLINPTRIAAFELLKTCGADIAYENKTTNSGEESANILVFGSRFTPKNPLHIFKDIASLIDEIPALSMLCAILPGLSVIENAKELRVKECDRIKALVEGLKELRVEVKERDDGLEILGKPDFKPIKALIKTYKDHRIAMSFALFGCELDDMQCINISFPQFFTLLGRIL